MRLSDAEKLQIGDLVVAEIDHPQRNHSIRKGSEGVVCDIIEGEDMIGVDWGFGVEGGHSCTEHCQYGYGWYVHAKEIRLSDAGPNQDIDEGSFLQVIGGIR